jgi:hypothetical protein
MTMERTELEWSYQPADFFEAPYTPANPDCSIHIESGKAIATLRVPQNPVDPALEDRIYRYLGSVFLVRQLQMPREYQLAERATVHQYDASGGKGVEIRVGSANIICMGMRADVLVTNPDGTVVRDSKAERIASYTSILDMVAPKAAQSPTLHKILESYARSFSDPDNALIHLYEIRDALKTHYGNKSANAKKTLGITNDGWRRFGDLADHLPLSQGRHRGTHPAIRSATPSELQEARTLAIAWILAFTRTL